MIESTMVEKAWWLEDKHGLRSKSLVTHIFMSMKKIKIEQKQGWTINAPLPVTHFPKCDSMS